ncbi:UNVERIFIED_CONTAM: hypothetical protein Sradi_4366800 [Sesamum radiatum]|uniref:Uncharacterized protein n=1 Tax=Sesamum radiatum TaxID=300843 RepID=A0AAW2NQV8_SESRA
MGRQVILHRHCTTPLLRFLANYTHLIISFTELSEVSHPPQLLHFLDHQVKPRHCLHQQRRKCCKWKCLRELQACYGNLAQGWPQGLPLRGLHLFDFFHSSNADESVLTLDKEAPEYFEGFWLLAAAARARTLVVALVLRPRKRRGWDLRAASRSCRASWRWSERITGEHWRCSLMLLASSISALDTSPATRMHGSLKRTRTDVGVLRFQSNHAWRRMILSSIMIRTRVVIRNRN